MSKTLVLALACTALAGPALAQPPGPAKRPAACFYSRDVSSFAPQGDRIVNLRVGVSRFYQLRLFAPCIDLDFSQRIALRSRGSDWICAGEAVPAEIFTHSAAGPQRCPVTSIRPLSKAEVAALPRGAKP